jgi:hypothetical protein
MAVLGEKLSGGPVDHLARLEVWLRALFLGSSRVHPTLLMACERLPRTWTNVESIHILCIRFSPVGCTSIQIAVTLIYE